MSARIRSPLPRAYAATAVVLGAWTVGVAAVHWLQPAQRPLAAADLVLRIDPNRARAAELELLPRIGPKLAATIIERRRQAVVQPAFRSLADLDAIKGIGPATLELIAPYLFFPADEQ